MNTKRSKKSRRLLAIVLSLCAVFALLPVSAQDGDVAEITDERFPDPAFRQWLAAFGVDQDGDGRLSQEELDAVKELDFPGKQYQGYDGPAIHSLEGIQLFRNMEILNCGWKPAIEFAELDLSGLTNLYSLSCADTNITALNLSRVPNLSVLNCGDTGISELDLSRTPELVHLDCAGTNVASLDLSGNPKLNLLYCSDTNLTTLDISPAPGLTILDCSDTNLESLDVSQASSLYNFNCSNTNLTTLNLSGNPDLADLVCDNTKITELDISHNPKLESLLCFNTKISSLDISHNPKLFYIGANNTNLISLSTGKTEVRYLTFTPSYHSWAVITAPDDTYDLHDSDPALDPGKISNLKGATLNGSVLSGYKAGTPITYDYNCGSYVDVNDGQTYPLFLSVTLTVNPFGDVDLSRYYGPAVEYVTIRGIMNGTDRNHFSPNGTATRGMIVTVLYRMEGSPGVEGMDNKFADVPEGKYYTDAVKWASNAGVVNGTSDDKFSPDDNVTREQFATMIYRYAEQIKGYYVSSGNATLDGFADKDDISSYATDAVRWAIASEKDMIGEGILHYDKTALIEGIKADENTVNVNPKGNATRAQMATMLYRFATGIQIFQPTEQPSV